MKLQFSANQQYQLDATNAVVELFNGQPQAGGLFELAIQDEDLSSLTLAKSGLGNRLVVTPERLLKNCQAVQTAYGIQPSEKLEMMTRDTGEPASEEADFESAFPNFTVEMETGTGKTYVYLRSIYELNKVYGFKKFVIVVPSVAIREGVLKNLQITHDHFQELYSHVPCSFSVYDSSKVNSLRSFALSNAIQVLVINIDAFAKDSEETPESETKRSKGNVINQMRETGIRPIEFIQATNPFVIVDEPQNMETDNRKRAIARLNPLCTLRYSATPRNAYNLIYQLDPVKAYELGLVKQIGVDSVLEDTDSNQAFIELGGFKTTTKSVSAKIKIWVNGTNGNGAGKKSITVKNGDNLFEKSSGREIYKDNFIVNEIDAGEGFIRFANDTTVYQGRPHGVLNDEIMRLQIETTIKRHFEKERRLKDHGIKVLSVFFIDRVANYRHYGEDGSFQKGKFAEWFEEIFEQYRQKPEFSSLYDFGVGSVHNGYFSTDRSGQYKDSTERGNQDDLDTYSLIMRDKEKLLDPNVPLRFIFSHSALREGWDNPNVFQICTLAESTSEVKKRQEIGRGLRLCVNDKGERIMDRAMNRLTIIANEAYEDFAKTLQSEFEQQGIAFKKELVQNERKKIVVHLRKGYEADQNFLTLWERIRARTRYKVSYETTDLIEKSVEAITKLPTIERPKITIARADLAINETGVSGVEVGRRTQTVEARYVMPDFVAQIQARTSLSKSTVARIILQANRLQDAMNNPQAFIEQVADVINEVKKGLLVSGVEYVKVDGLTYEMHRFKDDDLMEVFESNVIAVQKQDKTLFSHIVIDSGSTPERTFAEACENNEDVHFYIKLPRWFVIDTPVGTYNPDWALVYKNDQTLYFVAETKSTTDLGMLRPLEKLKIECGKKHFKNFEQVRFKVVSQLSELIT